MNLFDKILEIFSGSNQAQSSPRKVLATEVELLPGLKLPSVFIPYKDVIQQSKCRYISIHASPADSLTLQQSKFLDFPCLPKNFPYPTDKDGKFMIPLAQINFSECPKLGGFPSSGYLQFYIANDSMYGIDFDDQETQPNYRVLYFKEEDLTEPQTDFAFLNETMRTNESPVIKKHQLQFTVEEEYFGLGDFHGETLINPVLQKLNKEHPGIKNKLTDLLYSKYNTGGHKLGGYAYFTQWDPRELNENWHNHILLFQMDSDHQIMWGDAGVANFFIRPADLANLDFSKTVYNWDCC